MGEPCILAPRRSAARCLWFNSMGLMAAGGVSDTIPAAPGRSRRWRRGLAAWHDRKGATSLEFAIVGLLFVFWIMSTITFGLDILAQAAIDSATQVAGRQIQVGAIRSSADQVRSLVCAKLQGLTMPCSSIQVYATSGASFSSLSKATVSGTTMSPASFTPGGSQAYVLLQVAYSSPFTIPLAGASNLMLLSTIAFRNEP